MLCGKRIFEYGKVVFILCIFSIFCLVKVSFCQDNTPSLPMASTSLEPIEKTEETDSTIWQTIWGEKANDALLLGMWCIHLRGTGEYFGSGDSNEQNELLGIQYYGLSAGTFINSHDDRSWFFGSSRKVYSRQLSENTSLDIGYAFGLLYGYGDSLPNVDKVSAYATGTMGFTWYRFGFDIGIIPIGVVTGSFRINF